MKRSNCIFCKKNLDSSDEHIIPESLNGRLHSKYLICDNCNKLFGRTMDVEIKKQLNPLLLMMGFKNANGIRAKDVNEEEYLIKRNLTIEPIRPKVELTKIDGKQNITITGTNSHISGVLNKMNEILSARIKGGKFIIKETTQFKHHSPILKFPFKLNLSGSIELLLNKIAIEYYAMKVDSLTHLETLTERVYAQELNIGNVVFCNFSNEIRDFKESEISHVILIKGDPKTNILYAYIELFNLICGIVYLSMTYTGAELTHFYHQDVFTGERFKNEIKLKVSIDGTFTATTQNDNFLTLNELLSGRLVNRYISDTIDLNLKEILKHIDKNISGGVISKDEREKEYIKSAGQLYAHLAIYDFPYEMEIEEGKEAYEIDEYNFFHSNFIPDKVDDFINKHSYLLKVKLQVNKRIYSCKGFHKEIVTVKRKIKMVKLYIILRADNEDKDHLVLIRDFFEMLSNAKLA